MPVGQVTLCLFYGGLVLEGVVNDLPQALHWYLGRRERIVVSPRAKRKWSAILPFLRTRDLDMAGLKLILAQDLSRSSPWTLEQMLSEVVHKGSYWGLVSSRTWLGPSAFHLDRLNHHIHYQWEEGYRDCTLVIIPFLSCSCGTNGTWCLASAVSTSLCGINRP